MEFSDSIPCNTARPVFSPDAQYFATAQEYRLTVRHCDSLAIAQVFSCLDRRVAGGPWAAGRGLHLLVAPAALLWQTGG